MMTVAILKRVLPLAVLLLPLALQTYRLAGEQRAHADTRAQHAEHIADMERAASEAVKAARTEEQRRTAKVQKAADEAHESLARARADAVAATDAGQRLRNRIAALQISLSVTS